MAADPPEDLVVLLLTSLAVSWGLDLDRAVPLARAFYYEIPADTRLTADILKPFEKMVVVAQTLTAIPQHEESVPIHDVPEMHDEGP